MPLRITDITLRGFRSYDQAALADLQPLVILTGPNAVGKTNAIEAIQLLTALATFRHAPAAQLVAKGRAEARLSCTATDGNRLLEVALSIDERRRYQLNGKPKRPADLKGLLPSVTFTPDDLGLVKGAQSGRRRALDALGSQVNRNYYLIRKDYEKVLRHKNHLLKDQADPALVGALDEMVVTCGAQLTAYRAALVERLGAAMAGTYARLGAGEGLEVRFVPSWQAEDGQAQPFTRDDAKEQLARAIQQRRAEERSRGRALVGPQADAIHFLVDGMDATQYASQGQQRSIVLSWKLAEAAVITELLGTEPVLLLDDVMSELDGTRRQALVECIGQSAQAFVTTANLDYFDAGMRAAAQVITLPLEGC